MLLARSVYNTILNLEKFIPRQDLNIISLTKNVIKETRLILPKLHYCPLIDSSIALSQQELSKVYFASIAISLQKMEIEVPKIKTFNEANKVLQYSKQIDHYSQLYASLVYLSKKLPPSDVILSFEDILVKNRIGYYDNQ